MAEHNLPDKDDAPWLDCMDGFKDEYDPLSKLSRKAKSILDAYQHAPLEDEATIAEVLRTAALYCERDRIILITLAEEFEDIK